LCWNKSYNFHWLVVKISDLLYRFLFCLWYETCHLHCPQISSRPSLHFTSYYDK
ncbi:unnamed protein product, partial [Brassica oleracea]